MHTVNPEAGHALERLQVLVGTWVFDGELAGQSTFSWLPGGYFLQQVGELTLAGETHVSHEIIGHEKPFMGEAAQEITSRAYTDAGDTLDYTWELLDGVLTIWGGERGSPAFCRAEISADGTTMTGTWTWPGGGYSYSAAKEN